MLLWRVAEGCDNEGGASGRLYYGWGDYDYVGGINLKVILQNKLSVHSGIVRFNLVISSVAPTGCKIAADNLCPRMKWTGHQGRLPSYQPQIVGQ